MLSVLDVPGWLPDEWQAVKRSTAVVRQTFFKYGNKGFIMIKIVCLIVANMCLNKYLNLLCY